LGVALINTNTIYMKRSFTHRHYFSFSYIQDLLLSYNVGIHIDDREKHMMKRAAALVGLALPPDREPYVKKE
jgi:hypothetical protein